MNITTRDVAVLIVMSLAIVGMSFVMPAMGLTEANTDESDVPEFTINGSRFDFAGDFPDQPHTPASGDVFFNSDTFVRENQLWLEGNTKSGIKISVTSSNNGTLFVDEWDSGLVVGSDSYDLVREGQTIRHDNFSYEIDFVVTNYTSIQNSTPDDPDSVVDAYRVEYTIINQPTTGGGWLGRITEAGGLFETADALAGMLGWIGTVIWWFFVTIFEIALNLLALLVDSLTFFTDLALWLINTYGEVISSAEGFAQVFVAIPGIILSSVLAKVVFVALSLLPTT